MTRVERAVRALRALTWPQRAVLLRAWLLLPTVALGLRLVGYRRLRRWLTDPVPSGTRRDLAEAELTTRLVRGAAAWSLPRPKCLTRSLVLERLLRHAGLEAELRIGVERPDGTFAAHAWVEHAGVPLSEPEAVDERYAVLTAPRPRHEG